MKFCQLLSVSDSPRLADAASSDPDWAVYGKWVDDLTDICHAQDRAKLDHTLPNGFVRKVLTGSSQRVFYSSGQLRSYRFGPSDEQLSLVEAFDRFGGTALEEAFEKGSVSVTGALASGDCR
jgi:hypothetical protein